MLSLRLYLSPFLLSLVFTLVANAMSSRIYVQIRMDTYTCRLCLPSYI